jgi:hypothetical protein
MYMGLVMTVNSTIATSYHNSLLQTVDYDAGDGEPRNIEEAMRRPDADQWWACTMDEWQSFQDMGVFDFVPLPKGRRAIDSKIVYKLKRDENNLPIRYKARIVARGFQQQLGVDFFDSFSAMSHPTSVRAILAVRAYTADD